MMNMEQSRSKEASKKQVIFYITTEEEQALRLEIERMRARKMYHLPTFAEIEAKLAPLYDIVCFYMKLC